MTAHLLVPALDDVPATLSRRMLTGLLRDELGFDGLRDHGRARDASDRRRRGRRGGSRASDRGRRRRALHRPRPARARRRCDRRRARRRRRGRPAAARTARGGGRQGSRARRPGRSRRPRVRRAERSALDAARRALHVRGTPSAGPAPFVVELMPQANIAAGDLAHGLAELWPGADGIRLTSADDAGDLARRADGRPVVLVVRDAARHAWQRRAGRAPPGRDRCRDGAAGRRRRRDRDVWRGPRQPRGGDRGTATRGRHPRATASFLDHLLLKGCG